MPKNSLSSKRPLIAIVGQTASGKSDLAMRMAQKFNGEIICADSQTIRRELNIGTAKPTIEDQKLIPHHLLDIIGPYDRFTAADFQELALKAMEDISKRGSIPILVGGTGLYVDSILFDYTFGGKTDPVLRTHLNAKTRQELQAMVHAAGYKMPENDNNPRHLIRTLESSGIRPENKHPRPNTLVIGIDIDKTILIERIARRVNSMFAQGFIDEVKSVIKKYGYPPNFFDAIGYRIVLSHMNTDGAVDEEAVKTAMNKADCQYAKRQKTWFKRNQTIRWITSEEQADKLITTFLSKFATIEQ